MKYVKHTKTKNNATTKPVLFVLSKASTFDIDYNIECPHR